MLAHVEWLQTRLSMVQIRVGTCRLASAPDTTANGLDLVDCLQTGLSVVWICISACQTSSDWTVNSLDPYWHMLNVLRLDHRWSRSVLAHVEWLQTGPATVQICVGVCRTAPDSTANSPNLAEHLQTRPPTVQICVDTRRMASDSAANSPDPRWHMSDGFSLDC